jgi:acetylornithine/succinyldiaminopimelate/putrescine aminotransferase
MNKAYFYQHVAQTSPESIAIEVERAEGIYLYGPEGQRWIDFISGICVSNVGHGAPEVVQAVQAQAARYLHTMVYGESIMAPQVQYARLLAEVLGPDLDHVYFGNSGAEANEGALKVAKRYTGRQRLVAFTNSYHGHTHGALSVTGSEQMKEGYGPFLPDVSFLRYNQVEDLARIDQATAAVIVEAIQGAGGVILPEAGYLQALRQRCDETGALLILDEIQTGFGRTGHLFAHQGMGIRPDILTLAKALGGGLPLGAFITRQEVMEVIQTRPVLGHINTFGGGPVACAAGLALLRKVIDEDLASQAPAKGAQIHARLASHPLLREVRGMGLLMALIFEDARTADQVRRAALQRGLLTIGFLNINHGLRISPPLTISEAEIDLACDIWWEALDAVHDQ